MSKTADEEIPYPAGQAVITPETQSLVQELAGVGIDSVMQDGILKAIPFVGALVILAKTELTVFLASLTLGLLALSVCFFSVIVAYLHFQ